MQDSCQEEEPPCPVCINKKNRRKVCQQEIFFGIPQTLILAIVYNYDFAPQLNFATFKRGGRFSFRMLPPGKVQIPGFADDDSHVDVIDKAAKGLGINECTQSLSLMMSSGLVKNMPLSNGKAWTLGNFVEDFGGAQARGKKTFGICVPDDSDSEDTCTEESVYSLCY